MNIKNNCYRLLFEEKRYLDQTRFDNYIYKKYFVNYIRPKEKVHETLLGGLRCYYFFQSLRCGKTGNKLKLCNLSCNMLQNKLDVQFVILTKNDNNNNNNNSNKNCENINSLTLLFLVALGSDYSGAFRSEEDLRAMDDDIRKWYNVGNLFNEKIHFFSSFHLLLSKEVSRLSPPNVSLLLLRVFNRIESIMDNCLERKNVDLRQLKSFQNSLIQRASKVETSSLSLFYACMRNLPFSGYE